MAKQLAEVENPMVLERPTYRSPEPVYPLYKPDPKCCCGCEKTVVVDGWEGTNEYFHSDDCIKKVAIQEWGLKRVG